MHTIHMVKEYAILLRNYPLLDCIFIQRTRLQCKPRYWALIKMNTVHRISEETKSRKWMGGIRIPVFNLNLFMNTKLL